MYYILIGKNPIKVTNLYQWSAWFGWQSKNGGRFVRRTVIPKKKPIGKNKKLGKGKRRPSSALIKKLNKWREGTLISTVFLGIDHSFKCDDDNPVLFETMIFGGQFDGYQWRHLDWNKAAAEHNTIIKHFFKKNAQEQMEDFTNCL